jgi:BON domain/Glycosyl hydrolase family 12
LSLNRERSLLDCFNQDAGAVRANCIPFLPTNAPAGAPVMKWRNQRSLRLVLLLPAAFLFSALFQPATQARAQTQVVSEPGVFADDFSSDTSLNTALWTTQSDLLKKVAAVGEGGNQCGSLSNNLMRPILSFGPSGMRMSGANGWQQSTGIQSLRTFSPPFTFRTTVAATVANGNPFAIFFVSSDSRQWFSLYGNVNPTNQPYVGIKLGCEVFYAHPALGVPYTIDISAKEDGVFLVSLSSGSVTLATKSLPVGTGPFYLILGQAEGWPNTEGTQNVAVWRFVSLNTVSDMSLSLSINPNTVPVNGQATASGFVRASGGTPVSGTQVVLYSSTNNYSAPWTILTTTHNGSFDFLFTAPGSPESMTIKAELPASPHITANATLNVTESSGLIALIPTSTHGGPWCWDVNDPYNYASPAIDPLVSCSSEGGFTTATLGDLNLSGDLWNLASGSSGTVEMMASGSLRASVDFKKVVTKSLGIAGYPNLTYGWQPNGGGSSSLASLLPLPVQISSLPNLWSIVNYALNPPSAWLCPIDFAYDIWITKSRDSTAVFNNDVELMIWLYASDILPPIGLTPVETFHDVPTLINGTLTYPTWKAYIGRNREGAATTVSLVLTSKATRASVGVNIGQSIDKMISVLVKSSPYLGLTWTREDLEKYYVNNVSLGSEFGYSGACQYSFTIATYCLAINPPAPPLPGTSYSCQEGPATAPSVAGKLSTNQSQKRGTDDSIIQSINDKLLIDPALKGREILVTAQKGVVTLAGTVNNAAEKAAAERIAKSTGGVRQVINQLGVSTPR